jgi:hypothetical protein
MGTLPGSLELFLVSGPTVVAAGLEDEAAGVTVVASAPAREGLALRQSINPPSQGQQASCKFASTQPHSGRRSANTARGYDAFFTALWRSGVGEGA